VNVSRPDCAGLDGVIVVDKPSGWTSHDVVGKMRGIAGTKRIGHLGTLDPIATGVLPLMIGQATRLARFWDGSEKCYEAVIRFGFATSTYDRAGEPCGADTSPVLVDSQVEAYLAPFRGEIWQSPPPVSAKKINGVPAYKLVRKNLEVSLAAVKVTIHEIVTLGVAGSRAHLRIRCSSGTYIRSIAHDLGLAMGCGAHVEELVRTKSGPFCVEQALTLEKLQTMKDERRLKEALISMGDLLPDFPSVFVDDTTALRIRQGRDFNVSPFRANPGSTHVKAIDNQGKLIAIGQIALPHVYHPVIVVPSPSRA
jgi:tRNA pseudouridine55 synthase